MKIKRFVAADMRSAMNLVRKEHGPDAVILSNRRIEEGIEIVAAANYDESAVQRALEASRRDVGGRGRAGGVGLNAAGGGPAPPMTSQARTSCSSLPPALRSRAARMK
ncbi:hypothetical protein Q0S62_17815, partial [Stenotrophomonas indicatrix]|nr:hypothetical protein [Stenotrophomonas indicatrix]